MIYINQFISILLLLSGLFVIISKNPVHSVLSLVLSFVAATLILLILKIEFIAMLFLVVYIGAITVLFLFVVMMLNIKIVELKEKLLRYLPISISIIFIFLIEIIYLIRTNLLSISNNNNIELNLNNYGFKKLVEIDFLFFLDSYTNMEMLSFALYTKYIYMFIIAGMILFVAMVGAIILTLNQKLNSRITQDYYTQINSTFRNSVSLERLIYLNDPNVKNINK